ncbi:hypothetical protein E2C01_043454 [Portunus trituberculatus]|uniref:Uncharacterized protein n=1 Tax=Portunus trituberculatus TaxID=210409 RepID=A0A5B7FWF8_PORTR|nr:hypothetical protein [Portunus trituberculatus]
MNVKLRTNPKQECMVNREKPTWQIFETDLTDPNPPSVKSLSFGRDAGESPRVKAKCPGERGGDKDGRAERSMEATLEDGPLADSEAEETSLSDTTAGQSELCKHKRTL